MWPARNRNTTAPPEDQNMYPLSASTRCAFALVIGIDKYKSGDNLEGSVNDAKAVKAFLSTQLRVPDPQVVLLLNEAATRDAILSNFKSHLIHNDKIRNGDSIIFYYAGHGCRVGQPSASGSFEGTVGSLVPHDGDTPDRLIYDHIMDTLLHDLAKAKGNNVVVILDACHSSSVVRNTSSFVCLASCREEVVSYGPASGAKSIRGAFTLRILEALGQVRLDQATYYDLFNQLPRSGSHGPHCGGFLKHRLMFSTKLGKNPKMFRLTEHKKETREAEPDGDFVLDELAAQDESTETLPHEDPRMLDVADADSSILSRKGGGDGFVTRVRERVPVSDSQNPETILTVSIEQDFERRLASVLSQPDRGTQNYKPQWVRVDDPAKAIVKLWSNSGPSFKIETSFDFATESPNTILRFEREHELNDLLIVLHAVAHFHYHLLHNNSHKLEQDVRMGLYLLNGVEGQHVPNLSVGNLLKDSNKAKVASDNHANYGFEIVKKFIGILYDSPPNAPLRGRDHVNSSSLSIGYGVGGGQPFEFPLSPGVRTDTSFIKLFVSTTYIDMVSITQDSAVDGCMCQRRMQAASKDIVFFGSLVAVVTVESGDGE